MNKLNHKAILIAIFKFLDFYYDAGYKDLGGFLGSLHPAYEDNSPMDPSIYEDWLRVINKKQNLGLEESYDYMIKFLKYENDLGWPELSEFIIKSQLKDQFNNISIYQLKTWNIAIEKSKKYKIINNEDIDDLPGE